MAKQEFKVDNDIFYLPKRKIMVKPVIWGSSWLNLMGGKGHSVAWKQDNSKVTLQIPIDSRTGALVEPLTEAERKYFESDKCPLGFKSGDLVANKFVTNSRNKQVLQSYWTSRTYTILKSGGVINEDTVLDTLDLSNPKDYLSYVILRANKHLVAANPEQSKSSGRYILFLVDEGDDEIVKASRTDRLAEAYKHYSELSQRQEKIREFLTVAYMENIWKVKPAPDASMEWLKAEVNKLIQADSGDSYLKIANNQYEDKAFIFKCLDKDAIKMRKDGYTTNDGTWLGATLHQTVSYLGDPKNSEMRLKLIAIVDR